MKFILPLNLFLESTATIGDANLSSDKDLRSRRYGQTTSTENVVSTLAGAALQVLDGNGPARSAIPDEPFWLRYYGPPGTVPHVSYYEAVVPGVLPPGFFKDQVVWIGGESKTRLLRSAFHQAERRDNFLPPAGVQLTRDRFFDGVEIHATAFLNLLRQEQLHRVSVLADFILILVFGLILGGGVLKVPTRMSIFLAALFGVGFVTLGCWLQLEFGLWFSWMMITAVQLPMALLWGILYPKRKTVV